MKTQPLYRYVTLAALIGIWSCSSSRQTAQNASENDDLYGISNNSEVYASNNDSYNDSQLSRRQQRYERQQQGSRNANPDYNDEQANSANTDEYYTELSARNLKRGISPDPGWGDENSYNSGFVNGYNAASTSAYSWNRWGINNTGFYNGLGLGLGMSAFSYGYPGFGGSFGSPYYSPYYGGGAYAYNSFYSPYRNYDPFYSSYGFGGYGGYNSPYYGSYGGYYGNPVYVNNIYVSGADPYRNRTYVRNNDRSAGRYSSGFDNTPRAYNSNGGRRSADNVGSATPGNDGYYARPSNSSRGSSRGSSYYYDNGGNATSGNSGGRAGSAISTPSYNGNSNSSGDYYARPRQSSRGSYSPSDGGRSVFTPPAHQQQSQPSFQQPSQSSRSFSQPSYSAPSAPSSGGGGGRGPR